LKLVSPEFDRFTTLLQANLLQYEDENIPPPTPADGTTNRSQSDEMELINDLEQRVKVLEVQLAEEKARVTTLEAQVRTASLGDTTHGASVGGVSLDV
jgi:hypothetical protein